MKRIAAFFFCACASVPVTARGEGLQLSGGLDTRFTYETRLGKTEAEIAGLFLNLRKVWSDAEGDRWIGIAQGDLDDNLKRLQPYQVYLQYKGPLGRWNVRAGHFLLPFGLLATYDTERLLLQSIEEINLGIRHDTGAQLFGRTGAWDYALAVTDGLGTQRLWDSRANPVVTGRFAFVQDRWQAGLSALLGRVLVDADDVAEFKDDLVSARRVALDFTGQLGQATARAEISAGTDAGRGVWGGVLLADYPLTSRLELNTRYSIWHRGSDRHFAGLGLSYQVMQGLFLRIADNYEFGRHEKNNLTAQAYFEFTHRF